jgi:hypothetical protein
MRKTYRVSILLLILILTHGCTYIRATTSEGNITIDAHKNVEVVDPSVEIPVI